MHYSREYIEKLITRVKELDTEISQLEEIADRAVEEVKADYRQQINDLFLKKTDVQDKVNKVQGAGGDVWEDMKAGTGLSWEVFNDATRKDRKHKSNH